MFIVILTIYVVLAHVLFALFVIVAGKKIFDVLSEAKTDFCNDVKSAFM